MKSAILAIRIIGDATSAVAAMDKAQRASMSFKDKVGKASVAASAALAAIGAGAATCAKAAGDLQQSVGGVETVFGDSSKQMLAWSKNAAKSVGLSQNEYNQFATLVGSQLQNFGMSVDQSASKTNELIGLGADLSSMFGGTTADAVDALSSALKGEMDPIEKYGISLNDATLQAQAASMGLGDLYKSGDRNAKMQATLAAITAQSGKAVGNFAREADTAQGQQQRMNAAFENAKAALGEALLPFLTQMAEKLASVATWIQANTSWLGPLVGVIAAVAAVIVTLNAAMTAYSVVAGIVAAAQGAVNLAFLPVVAVILAIVAVIAVLVMNWDTVKKAAGVAADWIKGKWDALCSWLKNAWNDIGSFFSGIGEGIKNAFAGPINWIASKFEWLADKVRGVFDWIGGAWNKVSGWVSGLFGARKSVASASASYMAQPMRAYQSSRAIDPTATALPLRARASAPSLFNTTAPAGAAGVRPASVTVNISVDAHGNLDNDKVAGEIVASLDRWAKVRGRELAL
ncbi:hypothetical protein [uncultured Bifidobacterium sp.]|uniref:hypothetical protein n=1 Tax=uncultured Bifidobacterium sp. TaxID=165187 RepID=UPI00258C636F|nr:hypothetical protein [uncultured Bifidobacterium sp.]